MPPLRGILGNFLVSISTVSQSNADNARFQKALALLSGFKSQTLYQGARSPWVQAASLARHNGSASRVASDSVSQSWLLAVGTWFHGDGYGTGSEGRLLSRYLEVGAGRLGREMEGFFVLVISDARVREVFVITDVMGSCHGYQRSWNDVVLLCSSSFALAAVDRACLDPVGCQEFLQTGISYESRTLYKEINKLDPATVYRFSCGARIHAERYWKVEDLSAESLSDRSAVEALWESLTCAAKNIARDFPRPVCDLTGGYDSRAILAAFLGTHTPVAAAVSGPEEKRDVQISKSLARLLGVPHVHILFKDKLSFSDVQEAHSFTDGEFDPVEYAQILHVQRALSSRFDISLNGSYGGIARALWWELLFPHIGARRHLDVRRLVQSRYISPRYDGALIRPELRINLVDHLAGVAGRYVEGLSALPNTTQMDYVNLSMRIHRWQGRIASSTHQLWPCVSPFGLRVVLETVLQTDARSRLRSKLVRQMLASHQPALADFSLDRGYPAAPVSIGNFYRFAPIMTHFASRAFSKIRRTILGGATGSAIPGQHPIRVQLWQDERVRALLAPQSLKSDCILDSRALRNFLERSRGVAFNESEQWNRLLSLEYTLNSLAQLGAMPGAPR